MDDCMALQDSMIRLKTGKCVVRLLRGGTWAATSAPGQAVLRFGGATRPTARAVARPTARAVAHRAALAGGADRSADRGADRGAEPDVGQRAIILYTKETCPLCDGLKDKVQAILDRAPFTGSALNGYRLEPRDIMSNAEWERRYSMEIPVMAVLSQDGTERVVPRQSPRVTADRLEQAILKSLIE